jgi:chromosomal replication initiation ATPase DnaA
MSNIIWIYNKDLIEKDKIINKILENDPINSKRVRMDDLLSEYIKKLFSSINTEKTVNSFISEQIIRYRKYKTLIIDDIDYSLQGKEYTQSVFKILINKLSENNFSIMLGTTVEPEKLPNLIG